MDREPIPENGPQEWRFTPIPFRTTLFLLVTIPVILAVIPPAGRAEETAASPERTLKKLVPLPPEIPFPDDNPSTNDKIALGKQLFFDPRLSGDESMSCATCHQPEKGWGDGLPRAEGFHGKLLARNTQTLLNVAFQSTFFWDGRASSLEEQALAPIRCPDEMNQDLDQLVRKLRGIPQYREQFRQIFGSDVTQDGIAKALAAFQRTLVTSSSPLDRYLAGDKSALGSEARRGLELFQNEAGCIRCHHGPLLSDGEFYRLGVSFSDEGRSAVTGEPADRAKFRTPSLRNIADTGPYMHNGSLKTLADVVEFYLRGVPTTSPDGLDLDIEPITNLSFSDISALVAFLQSLSGSAPIVERPELP